MARPIISFIFLIFSLFPCFSGAYAAEELAVSEIFARADDAVVLVAAKEGNNISTGTGFFVSSDGLLLTSYHVVSRGDIFVRFKDKKLCGNVELVGYNVRQDLALLRMKGTGLKTVVLGDSNRVRVGEKVVAIGNPMGLESTVSDGIVSSLRKAEGGMDLIQISAPVSSGSSGGPVFNMQGKVIGVTASSTIEGQNLNFAIPINYASPLLAKAMKPSASVVPAKNDLSREELPDADRVSYIVRSGDTLSGIAKRFDTTVDGIMRLNNLSGTRIYSGQKIRVPKL